MAVSEGASRFDSSNTADVGADGISKRSPFAASRPSKATKAAPTRLEAGYALHVGDVGEDGSCVGRFGEPGQAGGVLSPRM